MKIKDFVKILRECGRERIRIVATDKGGGRKFNLDWGFSDNGPDWGEFNFHITQRQFRTLDTDAAKAILDYAYNSENKNRSLFSNEPLFEDYEIAVTWPEDHDFNTGGAWVASSIERIEIRQHDEEKTMIFSVDELPDWN